MKHGTLRLAISLLVAFLHLTSCDILRLSPFEVSQWGPGDGRFDDAGAVTVFLKFSHEPDKSSVEKNFSLLEDGSRVHGRIQWDGARMLFLPLAALEKNRDYTLELAADAHDTRGLSLDKSFEGRFSTRPDDTRVRLLAFYPEMDSTVDDPHSQIRLQFSGEVPTSSLHDHVSFNPAMSGVWHFEPGPFSNEECVFTPLEAWTHGQRYELRISSSLSGYNGKTIGREHTGVFFIGADTEKPFLSGAWRISENGDEEKLVEENYEGNNVFFENSGWEKSDRLRLNFSKPVDSLSVRNCLDAAGVNVPTLASDAGFIEEIFFRFENAPTYDSRFSLTLKSGVKDSYGNESSDKFIFRIKADGVNSKPPVLIGIRIPMAPGNANDHELISYGTDSLFEDLPIVDGADKYMYTVETESWIECYFDTAQRIPISNFSLMELFRVTTSNNVLTFSPRRIINDNFSSTEPVPGWEVYQRVEIQGKLTNTVHSGLVYIEISAGLADSAGNRNENPLRISLVK